MRYVDKFNAHIKELEAEGVVSGPLGSEHARGWVSNPVIVSKKWDPKKSQPGYEEYGSSGTEDTFSDSY